jgi:arabinose-5-phosphate isomerase
MTTLLESRVMTSNVLKELFEKERAYLNDFFDHIDLRAVDAVLDSLIECKGLIVLAGIGKSGLVAKKIAVTMTSTGSRAIFLSPTNALHGDLGILKPEDVFVILSKSGESDELLNLIPFVRNKKIKIIGIISQPGSRLAKAVDQALILPAERELCPFDMAPTTSTTIQTIVGDIIAIALMRHKGFTVSEFAASHPAGRLGKRITMKVSDLMLKGDAVPLCGPKDRLVDTLVELSNKQCGCVIVIDEAKKLLGIFTDGDLRRSLQSRGGKALEDKMSDLMIRSPRTIGPHVLAWDAMKFMESDQKRPIMVLPVVSEDNTVIGIIKMHDIVQSGI